MSADTQCLATSDHRAAPCSHAQRRLFLWSKLFPRSPAYNEILALQIEGAMDPDALAAAVTDIVQRQQVFRTRFGEDDGAFWQVVCDLSFAPPLARVSIRDVPAREQPGHLDELIQREGSRPFETFDEALARFTLIELDDAHHVLVVVAHHAIIDERGFQILQEELWTFYLARHRGTPAVLPPLPVQCWDDARREQQGGTALDGSSQQGYWTRTLADLPVVTNLQRARPRPLRETFRSDRLDSACSQTLSAQIGTSSRRLRASPFAVCLAALQVVIADRSGQTDVVIGSTVSLRDRPELQNLIGFFINTVVLRGQVTADKTFAQLVAAAQEQICGALIHRAYPFDRMVSVLRPPRSVSHHPLFQIHLTYYTGAPRTPPGLGLTVTERPIRPANAKYDLAVLVGAPSAAATKSVTCEFNPDVLPREQVSALVADWMGVLQGGLHDPDSSVRAILDLRRNVCPS